MTHIRTSLVTDEFVNVQVVYVATVAEVTLRHITHTHSSSFYQLFVLVVTAYAHDHNSLKKKEEDVTLV